MDWKLRTFGGPFWFNRTERRAARRVREGTRSWRGRNLTPYTTAWRRNLLIRDGWFAARGRYTPLWLKVWANGKIA